MERTDIFNKLNEIFVDILDLEEDPILTDETTADDIEGWDSIANVQLMERIQEVFGIKFSAYEISSWIDVGEMVDGIVKKLS